MIILLIIFSILVFIFLRKMLLIRNNSENFTSLQNKLHLLECKQKCYPDNKLFSKKERKKKQKNFIDKLGKLNYGKKKSKIWTSIHSHTEDDKLYIDSHGSDLSKYVNEQSKKLNKWPIIKCNRYCKPLEYTKDNISRIEKSDSKLFWIKEIVSPVGGNLSKYR